MRIGVDASMLSGHMTGIGRYVSSLSKALLEQGAELYFYSFENEKKKIAGSETIYRVARILFLQSIVPLKVLKDDIDIFWGGAHRLPRFLSKDIAQVVTVHDLVWKYAAHTMRPMSRAVDKVMMRQAVCQADRILTVSKNTCNDIVEEYPWVADRIRVVRPGLKKLPSLDDFLYDSFFLNSVQSYILFVGTLEPRKNLARLLEAYGKLSWALRQQYPLVVVGDSGWGNVNIHHLIQKFDLEGTVYVTGFVSDAQLAYLYSRARLLAMPSLYEGFGLPILEAMMYGVPALASNISSMPEVVGNGGILVNPFDVDSIKNAMIKLLVDNDFYEKLSAHALLRSQNFTWEKAARETLAVFQEALREKRDKVS